MNNPLPNFLIAGATKCGTSSLYNYLAQHPDVFMSKIKEPRFLSSQVTPFPLKGPGDDKVEAWYVKKHTDYVRLFRNAADHPAIGESSADTLYFYKGTIPVIKKYLGDPKIIILLRNPVKRAFSAWQHLVRDMREDLSFEAGLERESQRIRDNWELIYHYTAASLYYHPVKAFMDNFSHVKVILTDDQQNRPKQVLRDIFRFLDVDPQADINTEIRYNVSGVPKSRWLHDLLFRGNKARKIAQPIVRKLLSRESRLRLAHRIQETNLTRLKIKPDTAGRLKEFFSHDVAKLETLIQRDLSAWRA